MTARARSFCPPWRLDTDSPSEILSESPCCEHRTADVSDVGQVRLDHSADDELDRVISELDKAMVQAMNDGDRTGAELYRDRMYAAMSSRSPAHQSRLHAKAWQRMLDEDYFGAMGQQHRERGIA
jgi:hypothetical protein